MSHRRIQISAANDQQLAEGSLPGYHAATMEALISMSEASLQSRIVEPLLRLMGFQHVRDMSGPDEKGKDLVAVKSELGRPKLYAIQIKKFQASGKHSKTNAMTRVVTQLRQTMLEPVLDPMTHVQRIPDRGVFITPYAIRREALASALEQVRDLERREITIIDGSILVDLVLGHMPEAVTDMNAQLRYRVQLAKAASLVPELAILGMNESLSLDELFVEISLVHGRVPLGSGIRQRIRGSRIIRAEANELETLRALFANWLKGVPRIWIPPKRGLTAEEELRHVGNRGALAEIDLDPLLSALDSKLGSYTVDLANAARTSNLKELNRVIGHGLTVARAFDSLTHLELVRANWPELIRSARALSAHHETALVAATVVAGIDHPVLITGEPGGGKTTLLRRLSQVIARTSSAQLPLLIPLVRLKAPTVESLITECRFALSNLGYDIEEDEFLVAVSEGRFRLLLDGLDEAGSYASKLFDAIRDFYTKNRLCQITITCRDTLALEPWGDAVHLQLNSFTNVQLRSFVERWFRAEPSARHRLDAWFTQNPRMLTAARTPLIAALLCSLHHAEAEMPTTEVELYEERFGMLLGKWERAKGIGPLSPMLRQRYWHFLMNLAISMHKEEKKSIVIGEAMFHARQLQSDDLSAEAIVMDCIYRGIFLRESTDYISFGHLTYQEFLAARWLSRENPVGFILHKLGSSWWAKALEFYAAIHGDISQLIQESIENKKHRDILQPLLNLASFAPLTRRGILQELRNRKDSWRSRDWE